MQLLYYNFGYSVTLKIYLDIFKFIELNIKFLLKIKNVAIDITTFFKF